MATNPIVIELESIGKRFNKSISVLTEEDSNYKPSDEMMTVAQQVAHTSQTINWFTEGTFRDEGYDMDFEKLMGEVFQANSLEAEKIKMDLAIKNACEVWGSKSEEELYGLLPDNQIMGQIPRVAVLSAINDHTAHHRGSLVVYARLTGKVPPMPYMDE